MVAHVAAGFEDAEAWDLEFWQAMTPEERLRSRRRRGTLTVPPKAELGHRPGLRGPSRAFIYHAKPRYTKDMDLWVDPQGENVARANQALAEFGSPSLLGPDRPDEILQLGVAPNRIDLLRETGLDFDQVWVDRIEGRYGRASASWVDIDSLIAIKSRIDEPRHQEDVRVLKLVRERRKREG